MLTFGPIAQLDRALDYESRCREFESLLGHHSDIKRTASLCRTGSSFYIIVSSVIVRKRGDSTVKSDLENVMMAAEAGARWGMAARTIQQACTGYKGGVPGLQRKRPESPAASGW